ncbi:unnamed protein product [Fraxinus pennsylvanica]|uniref:Uncharacterized protein n=1 Tax=Fraxinus pennsylvanica TaxID=56036 RepID=A0AAD2DY99_9LAMI|nr:unnamed protein product [Fraxinus pennsylvanica]
MENEKHTAERNAGEVEEEDDEKKIEEFFALIRKFKDLRNQMNDHTDKGKNKRKRKPDSDSDEHQRKSAAAAAWVPVFHWEDFTADVKFRRPSSVLPPPCNIIKKDDDEVSGSSGLDLKLTL